MKVPNTEGRAGMCGIVDADGSLDLGRLARDLQRDLPPYARPVFLRVMGSVDMTGETRGAHAHTRTLMHAYTHIHTQARNTPTHAH